MKSHQNQHSINFYTFFFVGKQKDILKSINHLCRQGVYKLSHLDDDNNNPKIKIKSAPKTRTEKTTICSSNYQ